MKINAEVSLSNRYPTPLLQDLNAQHHFHGFMNNKDLATKGVRVIVKGEGAHIWDSDGARILDGMAGLWTTNVGYGNRELADVAHAQMLELPFYSTFFRTSHPAAILLARKLASIAPDGINQVFYGSSGSEANDTAIKLIRRYWVLKGQPKRQIIISRRHAYHGSSIGSGSMGGMSHVHEHTYPVYPGFRHIMDPYWCLVRHQKNLGSEPLRR